MGAFLSMASRAIVATAPRDRHVQLLVLQGQLSGTTWPLSKKDSDKRKTGKCGTWPILRVYWTTTRKGISMFAMGTPSRGTGTSKDCRRGWPTNSSVNKCGASSALEFSRTHRSHALISAIGYIKSLRNL